MTTSKAEVKLLQKCCFLCGSSELNGAATFELKCFAIEHLLEFEREFVEETWGDGGDDWGRRLSLCVRHTGLVKKAKELYLQLVETVKQFRFLKKMILKEARGRMRQLPGIIGQKWGQAVNQHEYKLNGEFTVCHPEDWVWKGTLGISSIRNEPPVKVLVGTNTEPEVAVEVKVENVIENRDDEDLMKMEVDEDLCGGDDNDSKASSENTTDNSADSFSSEEEDKSSTDSEEEDESDSEPSNIGTLTRKRKLPAEKQETQKKRKQRKYLSRNLTCHICGEVFHKYYLRIHLEKVHGLDDEGKPVNRQQTCDMCKETLSVSEMLSHVREHVGQDYLYKCPSPWCPFVFPGEYSMRKHLTTHANGRTSVGQPGGKMLPRGHKCHECDMVLGSIKLLGCHLNEKHESDNKKEKAMQCPISHCSKTFHLRQSVEIHLFQDHIPNLGPKSTNKLQVCTDCGLKKISCDKADEHLREVHGAKEIIRCSLCPYLFSCREHLINHLYNIHRKTLSHFTCDICQKQFGIREHLEWRKHYLEVHQIGREFTCDICNAVFYRPEGLTQHKHRFHKNLECDICGEDSEERFSSLDKLNAHKAQVHKQLVYKCGQCTNSYQTRALLDEHIQKEHKGLEGPLKCLDCAQVFKNLKTLKRHKQNVHENPKKMYVCHECGKQLACANSLRQHVNSIHLGLKQFVCDVCGESFKNRGSLRKHLTGHSDGKQ